MVKVPRAGLKLKTAGEISCKTSLSFSVLRLYFRFKKWFLMV